MKRGETKLDNLFILKYGCDSFEWVQKEIEKGISNRMAYDNLQFIMNEIWIEFLSKKETINIKSVVVHDIGNITIDDIPREWVTN